jgi:hypothetical protein
MMGEIIYLILAVAVLVGILAWCCSAKVEDDWHGSW